MNPIKAGRWRIHSVEVNSRPADEGMHFHSLVSTAGEIRFEPAGISLAIQQATARSAVLESRSQIFFADFLIRGDNLTLNLTRPALSEQVVLKAVFEAAIVDSN